MNENLEEILRNALSGMAAEPKPLIAAVRFYAGQSRSNDRDLWKALVSHIVAGPNDGIRRLFNSCLGQWDWQDDASWTAGTKKNTRVRRERIYDLLRLEAGLRNTLNEHVPPYEGARVVVIESPQLVPVWYTHQLRTTYDFYWKRLKQHLEKQGRIDQQGINLVGESADRILERLADPASADIYRARGLVVGYVQSGKTTNFTAVIAKAIDVGYRLIIVLSGTTNLLRNQTQRRLDMELVGVENILRGASEDDAHHDYVEDEGWPASFNRYGQQPSLCGSVDIHRLTGQEDFSSRQGGLNPMEFEFEKRDRKRPLYDRENLDHAGARIAVVKKQQDRLKWLIRELKSVGATKCAEVPALIIDDESDQASVNTVNPKKIKDRARTLINERIVEILKLLPRAQYIGYTATPFANVLVNPKDPADIYPKDFIVSLPRPKGYMGASEFLDLESPAKGVLSNEESYIRDIPRPDKPTDFRLLEAMDAFVLSGALKKYREEKSDVSFRHHTMLVHHSVRTGDQERVVGNIRLLWKKAGYDSPGEASSRLAGLFEGEFRRVWLHKGRAAGLKYPKAFSELRPYLGTALDEIRRGKSPVLMVNSAEGAEVPDFDRKAGVWKIIVGGAKLSRGYTVEGLTVSYFRRRSQMQDTLMQMGRWFGYRPGYADLVRLYIGRAELVGGQTMDLYSAFEAMCRDEELFRSQLALYEGKGGITPSQIPALVFNSFPSLRPTSRSKMFHARVLWAAFDYREPTSQAASGAGRKRNAALFSNLIEGVNLRLTRVTGSGGRTDTFDVKWAEVPHAELLSVLGKLEWARAESPIAAQLEFLRRKESPVSSWILVAPQIAKGGAKPWQVGAEKLSCVTRKRLNTADRFGVFSSPEHLEYAKWLVGGQDTAFQSSLRPRRQTGVLLFYPTRERMEAGLSTSQVPVMGFGMALPATGAGRRIAFSV